MTTETLSLLTVAAMSTAAAAGIVETYSVGGGGSTAQIQIDFANGNGYLIDVAFDDDSISGHDTMLLIAAEIDGFLYEYTTSEWGVFVEGLGLGADYDWGVGSGWPEVEDYWHYWVDTGSGWESAMTGNDVRMLADGDRDGWVFLHTTAPQSIPAPGVLCLLIPAAWQRRRRR